MKHLFTFIIFLLSWNYGFSQCSSAITATVNSCDQTVTFAATDNATNDPNLTYTWDFGYSGSTTATGTSVTHTFPTINGGGTNSYNVTLTVTGGSCGANGSSSIDTVVIGQVPVASIEHVILYPGGISIPGNFTNCNATQSNPNYTFSVNDNSGISSANTTYTIDWGDGNTFTGSSITNVSHQYTSQGLFNVLVTATGISGCSDS